MTNEYIKGFFDGEGSVRYSDKWRTKQLFITNTDFQILNKIKKHLSLIKIYSYILIHTKESIVPKRKKCFRLWITGYKNIKKYGEEIGFTSIERKQKWKNLMKGYRYNKCRGLTGVADLES